MTTNGGKTKFITKF